MVLQKLEGGVINIINQDGIPAMTILYTCAKVLQSCPTLCDLMDCSLPGSSVHGILQARIWSGLPFPSPGDLPDPRIEPRSPALEADSLPTEQPAEPLK